MWFSSSTERIPSEFIDKDPIPKLSWSSLGVKRELAEDEGVEDPEADVKGRVGGRSGVSDLLGAALGAALLLPSVVANLEAMGRGKASCSGIGGTGTGSTTGSDGVESDFLRNEKNRDRPFVLVFPLEET